MGEQTYTPGQSGNWTCTVTGTALVECWGGGGGGGGGNNKAQGGGGGAGGQYAKKSMTLHKGTVYAYSAGADRAGSGKDVDGVVGNDTYFGPVGSPYCRAKGGAGGLCYDNSGNGGIGAITNGIGDTVYAGGNGGNDGSGYGGGGGGGAGSSGTGNNANNATGGVAKSENGGAGGNGYTGDNGSGSTGEDYGGGGGGATNAGTGGTGNGGYIKITWENIAGSNYDLNFREYGYRV